MDFFHSKRNVRVTTSVGIQIQNFLLRLKLTVSCFAAPLPYFTTFFFAFSFLRFSKTEEEKSKINEKIRLLNKDGCSINRTLKVSTANDSSVLKLPFLLLQPYIIKLKLQPLSNRILVSRCSPCCFIVFFTPSLFPPVLVPSALYSGCLDAKNTHEKITQF